MASGTEANIALVFGITGQDGAYLARYLVERGAVVHGTTRDRTNANFGNLDAVGVTDRVVVHSVSPTEFQSVMAIISDVRPRCIYNLAAQSSVALSFSRPVETIQSTVGATVNILEAIHLSGLDCRFFNAASSECFGNIAASGANEDTVFHPRSPYGVGKAAAYWAVANYREAYDLFACSGILFNHESPLRPSHFVTQKIVRGAVDIYDGLADVLQLGALGVVRDWGWSPEYVETMVRMLDIDEPHDFVIATGEGHSLETFVERVFVQLGLDWRRYVVSDNSLVRRAEINRSVGDPTRARQLLKWEAQTKFEGVISNLVAAEVRRRSAAGQ